MIIDGFPGKLEKVETGTCNNFSYNPTPEQEQWILDHYRDLSVSIRSIARTIGASTPWITTFCHRKGIYRAESEMRKKLNETSNLKRRISEQRQQFFSSTTPEPEEEDEPLGINDREPCIGAACYNYRTPGCMLGSTPKPRTTCNALF